MSRFSQEMKVIPRAAWVIAVVSYLVSIAGVLYLFIPNDPNFIGWPGWVLPVFAGVIPLFFSAYVLLVGYVYGDARRRGMRYVMWTLLAFFIPNAIGVILYFILREPLLVACRSCGTQVRQGFAFCWKCGTALAHACPECRSAVEPGWSHCAKCGAKLAA
jgi:predicted RNA-binding Zn-ribbon protein involved in translation (DUF1610 family)